MGGEILLCDNHGYRYIAYGRKTTVVPIPVYYNNNSNNDNITTCTLVVCVGTSLNIVSYNVVYYYAF